MCNCSKKCGCNITQITKGEKGDNGVNGTNGTNAFKFVKEFDYDGSSTIDILYTQITACNPIPEGCYADATFYDEYVDYHIQLWQFIPAKELTPPQWLLVPFSSFSYQLDATNGNITMALNTLDATTYRLVILA